MDRRDADDIESVEEHFYFNGKEGPMHPKAAERQARRAKQGHDELERRSKLGKEVLADKGMATDYKEKDMRRHFDGSVTNIKGQNGYGIRGPKGKLPEEHEMEDENLVTETSAIDTLRPGAGSGGTESRAQMVATFAALLSQLGTEDLSYLHDQALALIGHEADQIAPNAADQNRATIMAKPTVKEDIAEMFSGDDLTEEFKERAEVIFEAALGIRLEVERAKLEEEFEATAAALVEEYEANLSEQTERVKSEMVENLDQYLNYVIEQWVEENRIAIESGLRTQIAEDFISSIYKVFTEHHIRVPEQQVDLVAEMKSEIDDLRSRLNEAIDSNIQLVSRLDETTKEGLIDEVSESLTVTQSEKLRTLAEGIEFKDPETYRRKLNVLKENYFAGGRSSTGLITESIDGEYGEEGEEKRASNPDMARYVAAISKSIRT